MNIVPNELNITINTSIPGYQKIKYNPTMTIKNISSDDRKVNFNPLVKLSKVFIDKTPEDLRQKQFFNKGLFDSLNNYTLVQNSSSRAKNLNQASHYGYIDNNIKVTLNTIFPDDSVIYIAGNPYVIADVQWTSGDWRVDVKQKKEEIDINKITDPYLYSTIVSEDIISGQQQLADLSPGLLYGNNYVGPSDVGSGVSGMTGRSWIPGGPIPGPGGPIPGPGGPIPGPGGPIPGPGAPIEIRVSLTGPPPPPAGPLLIGWTGAPPPAAPLLIGWTGPSPSSSAISPITNNYYYYGTKRPMIKNAPTGYLEDNEEPGDNEELGDNEEPSDLGTGTPRITPILPYTFNKPRKNGRTKNILKTYFTNRNDFYELLTTFYFYSGEEFKTMIDNTLRNTTNINVQRRNQFISVDAYNDSVNSLYAYENAGGGNCFFIAVSDAINLHNESNANRIFYNNYGVSAPFDVNSLRNMIQECIRIGLRNPDIRETFNQVGRANADELNNIISSQMTALGKNKSPVGKIFPSLLVDVYRNHDNFWVRLPSMNELGRRKKHDPNSINIYFNPYRPINMNNPDKIEAYINSEFYWGDHFAIDCLCKTLQLNVIIISNINDNYLDVNYGIFVNTENTCDAWDKYMFLYHYGGHFELLSFGYNTIINGVKQKKKTEKYIFMRDDRTNIPPFYIIFLIYGSRYYGRPDGFKTQFSWYPEIMATIDNVIVEFLTTPGLIREKNTFITLWNDFFPQNPIDLNQIPNQNQNVGGAIVRPYQRPYQTPYQRPYNNSNYPYYGNTPYGRSPYLARNMVKPEYDPSKLAYYITIDMELYPGTTIPSEEKSQLKCRQKWNSVRKAYANFLGKPYVISPIYQFRVPNKKPDKTDNKKETRKMYAKPRRGGTKKMYSKMV